MDWSTLPWDKIFIVVTVIVSGRVYPSVSPHLLSARPSWHMAV